MYELIFKTFAYFGIVAVLVFISVVLAYIKDWIADQISMAKYRYKRKHRFDKPPTAKCYCKDCIHNSCGEYPGCGLNNHKYVEDDFFCKKAEPRKHDPDKKKNK